MRRISGLMLLALVGCQDLKVKEEQRPYKVEAQSPEFFSSILNEPGSELPLTLVNADYPIEVQIFKDGRFFYRLKNLKDGEGWGTWRHEDGRMRLYASRLLFVMNMDIRNVSGEGATLAIEFADRKASRFLRLTERI